MYVIDIEILTYKIKLKFSDFNYILNRKKNEKF